MKTILKIEIETPDNFKVWEDASIITEEEAFEKLGKEETIKFQKEFAKGVHKEIVSCIENVKDLVKDEFEMQGKILEDYQIEDWDSLEDYKVNIKLIQ